MASLLAVLLFVGNAILFWLWSAHLLPLFQSMMRDSRGQCPYCGH